MQPDPTPDLECEWCGRSMSGHMRAYYFGFDSTGSPAIDRILCSVAAAGKGYHHTEGWTEAEEGEESCVGLIQRAASEAAKAFSDAARERDELRAENEQLRRWRNDVAVLVKDEGGIHFEDVAPRVKELRARAEKAEADLAESWRLVEKAEARASHLDAALSAACGELSRLRAESSALSKVAAGSRAPGRVENAQEELPDQGSSKTRIPSPEDIEAAKDALRDIAQDPGCAVPVTVTKKNPRSVQYEFGVADGHRVAAAKALAALAKLEGSS